MIGGGWGAEPVCPRACVIATILCFLPETYFRNLEEKLTQNKLILKEELKTLLHLCQFRDDVELAKNVIYR
jgi:pentatricopeptide repeat domain-containing protein 2